MIKLNKKQLRLFELVGKCGYIFRSEVDKQEYPDSMIDALINKGLLTEYKNKLTSTSDIVFSKDQLKNSCHPADFIPNGAVTFIAVDEGSPDGDCTMKGFIKDGEYHVQSVEYKNT